MADLTIDDGRVSLDDVELPGHFEQFEVGGKLRLDRREASSRSGSAKLPKGWADAEVSLRMSLTTTDEATCYQQLRVFEGLFKAARTGEAKPKVFVLTNRHANARGIREVLFTSLTSSETALDDTLSVSLSFVEYVPQVVKRERAKAKKDTSTWLERVHRNLILPTQLDAAGAAFKQAVADGAKAYDQYLPGYEKAALQWADEGRNLGRAFVKIGQQAASKFGADIPDDDSPDGGG